LLNPVNKRRLRGLVLGLACLGVVTPIASQAPSTDEHDVKVREADSQSAKAAKVFDEIMQIPEKSIPRDLLARAQAIAVFPEVHKASFVIGGEGGRGMVSRRTTIGWSTPVFFRGGGPSVGFQLGASETDFVLLFMNDDAVNHLMNDRFEIGADAGVAAGPVGREASAGTDAAMHAEILSYSRSRGLFAGVSLKGVVIRPEDDLNRAVYGKSAREILSDKHAHAGSDEGLSALPNAIAHYAPGSYTPH
jgi:SH3 domain-containing YSC84-like protein 1